MILRAVISRIGWAGLVLLGAASLGFLAMKLIPGDPVDVMLGPHAQVPEAQREQLREAWGLNLPEWQQYLNHLVKIITLDFGMSYRQGKGVLAILAEQAGPTLALACFAMVLALVASVTIAVFTRRGLPRGVAEAIELFAVSSPVFWIALVLAAVFNHQLGWLPILSGNEFAKLILPAVSLAIPITATISQVLRQALIRSEEEPFALTVRARGASQLRLTLRHTLRHSFASVITLSGYIFASILGGTVLIETIYARPGLGRVTLDAINERDVPIVLAVIFFSAVLFLSVNLLVDLLAAVLDPRLRATAFRVVAGESNAAVTQPRLDSSAPAKAGDSR